jgi:hypothetical protein
MFAMPGVRFQPLFNSGFPGISNSFQVLVQVMLKNREALFLPK